MLPKTERMAELLGLDDPSIVQDVLRDALLDPLAEATSTRGKRIRGQLVTLGYRLVSDTPASRSCHQTMRLVRRYSRIDSYRIPGYRRYRGWQQCAPGPSGTASSIWCPHRGERRQLALLLAIRIASRNRTTGR